MRKRWLLVGFVALTIACNLPFSLSPAVNDGKTPSPEWVEPVLPGEAPEAITTPTGAALLPLVEGNGELPTQPADTGQLPEDVPLEELNLSQQDAPELNLKSLQGGGEGETLPTSVPLAPQVQEQSQRVFERGLRGGRVTATLMRLETPVNKEVLTALLDACLLSCQPCANACQSVFQYSGDPKSAGLGSLSIIRPFEGACGKGYLVLFGRGNVAVLITGCGNRIEPDLLLRIGRVIDLRLVEQMGGAQTVLPSPAPGTPAAYDAECTSLKLTPEECANSGSQGHAYIITLVENWVNGKQYTQSTPNTLAYQIFPFPEPFRDFECPTWQKIGPSKYECRVRNPSGTKLFQITFNLQGYVLLYERKSDRVTATIQTTYIISDWLAPTPSPVPTSTSAPAATPTSLPGLTAIP